MPLKPKEAAKEALRAKVTELELRYLELLKYFIEGDQRSRECQGCRPGMEMEYLKRGLDRHRKEVNKLMLSFDRGELD